MILQKNPCIIKIAGAIVIAILCAILIYVASSIIMSRITIEGAAGDITAQSAYLKIYEHHSEIIVPLKDGAFDWTRRMGLDANGCIDECRYVAFGWGHEEFYLTTPSWADLKLRTALKASFGIGGSVMHVSYYGSIPDNSIRLLISRQELIDLDGFIDSGFVKDPTGQFVLVRQNPNGSRFYESNMKYSMFYTCNSWVNSCLKRAKQKASLWTPFVDGIEYQYNGSLR